MADFNIKTYDYKIHNIYITGDVDENMWINLVNKINEIKGADKEIDEINVGTLSLFGLNCSAIHPAINIYLNSYGGVIHDALAIYDEIKKLTDEYEVNIYCTGKVMSAATIIMLAVDLKHRFSYTNTIFMYHTLSSGTYDKIKQMEEDVEECKRLHNIIWKIYKENTGIPESKLDEIYTCKKDWYINAEQAKKYKIISKIL